MRWSTGGRAGPPVVLRTGRAVACQNVRGTIPPIAPPPERAGAASSLASRFSTIPSPLRHYSPVGLGGQCTGAECFLLRPVDPRRGNRRILYDVNNRGNKLALWTFNDGERSNDPRTLAHAGDGFLLREGYSLLWSGWNGEVVEDGQQRLLTGLPVATKNGETITGRAHLEIATTEKVFSRAFSWSPWGISDAFPAGSGKGVFNYRFRMSTEYGTYHEGMLSGSEFFPLAPVPQTDPVTGETGETLARARAAQHVPRMMFVQSSTEYWNRAASLLHTDAQGKTDLELPPEVRVYLVAGAQHLGTGPHTRSICQQPRSILDDRGPILRALLVALDRWVSDGAEPPLSRYPRIDDGTLVSLETFRRQFPSIAGVNLPEAYYQPARLDFGPRFHTEGIAEVIPPTMGPRYRTLVPAVDADGNDLAGIRLPEVAVPLGTFTGWNLRAAPFGAGGKLSRLDGMYLPFARTRPQRQQPGDPRPAVDERYPTRADYLARITEAALRTTRRLRPRTANAASS